MRANRSKGRAIAACFTSLERQNMSATKTAENSKPEEKTWTVDYGDGVRIVIKEYGVAASSEQRLHSYATIRYSYHYERTVDGVKQFKGGAGGFRSWEDALVDAQ